MKIIFKSYIILSLFLFSQKITANELVQTWVQKLGVKPGLYELTKGDEKTCLDNFLEINLEPVNDDVTLRIGDKFIFAYINKNEFTEDSLDNCKMTAKTTLNKNTLTQTKSWNCPKKSKIYDSVQTQIATIDQNTINYQFTDKSQHTKKTQSFSCTLTYKEKLREQVQ